MLKYFKLRYLGFLLLGYFYFKVDWNQIGAVFQVQNPLLLLACLFIIPPQVFIKSERWRYLLKQQGHRIKALDSFMIYMSATLFGSITPGRAGELAKVYYLQKQGMPIGRAFSSVVVDRVFDLYFLGLVASSGLIVLKPWPRADNLGLLGIFMLLLGPLTSSFILKKIKASSAGNQSSKKPGLQGKVIYWIKEVNEGIKSIKSSGQWWTAFLTIFGFIIFYFQLFLVAQAFQLPLSYLQVVFVMAFSSLVGLIPITVAGIGTREVTLLIFLSPLHIPLESVLAFSMGALIFVYVGQGIIGAITFWLRPFDIKAAKNIGEMKT
jgi:uncharacterized protein (TIRG00374 family)